MIPLGDGMWIQPYADWTEGEGRGLCSLYQQMWEDRNLGMSRGFSDSLWDAISEGWRVVLTGWLEMRNEACVSVDIVSEWALELDAE